MKHYLLTGKLKIMAECSSPQRREITYFGPIYINNNCIQLPVETKDDGDVIKTHIEDDTEVQEFASKKTQTTKQHRMISPKISPKKWLEHVGKGVALLRNDKPEKPRLKPERTFVSYKDDDSDIEYVLERLDRAIEKAPPKRKEIKDAKHSKTGKLGIDMPKKCNTKHDETGFNTPKICGPERDSTEKGNTDGSVEEIYTTSVEEIDTPKKGNKGRSVKEIDKPKKGNTEHSKKETDTPKEGNTERIVKEIVTPKKANKDHNGFAVNKRDSITCEVSCRNEMKIDTCTKQELEIDKYIDEISESQDTCSYDESVKSGYEEINKLWYGTNLATENGVSDVVLSEQPGSNENIATENDLDVKHKTTQRKRNLHGKKKQTRGKEYYATESRADLRRFAKTNTQGLHRRCASDGLLDRRSLDKLFESEDTKRWSHGLMLGSGIGYSAVIAIDFGTTYSGYAYCFTHDPENIYMMRKTEGGDPGIFNQKAPTTILLTPEGNFHSFGFAARDFYHDLDHKEASRWLYFERFKMLLHLDETLTMDAKVVSSTGKEVSAMKLFSYGLAFFKDHALQELSDQSGMRVTSDMIQWVITVPAIWRASAKQFMRQAAYNAGIVSPDRPGQLLIALEPEAASIHCQRLRLFHVVPSATAEDSLSNSSQSSSTQELSSNIHNASFISNDIDIGTRYMIVDCGGGTTDITVHEVDSYGYLKEITRACGGPYGSLGIDKAFEHLLSAIFGKDLVAQFRLKRPTGWLDLMISFESRKRSASPYRSNAVTVSFPYSFIDFFKKCKGNDIEHAVKKYGDKDISWTSSGMLRMSPSIMRRLFLPTINRIKQEIGEILNHPDTRGLSYLFLVGGFAESSMLQHEIRKDFGQILKVIIPQGVDTIIVKGAVLFGMNPRVVSERRSRLTYGVGVLHRFKPAKHPESKKVVKDGIDWCTDILDGFVFVNQSIALGETVVRSYTPVRQDQTSTVINIYNTDRSDAVFTTDKGVKQCGTLRLDLKPYSGCETNNKKNCENEKMSSYGKRREIRASMMFGDTEIKVTAIDTATRQSVHAFIDFLNT